MKSLIEIMEYCIDTSTDYYKAEFINWLSGIYPLNKSHEGVSLNAGKCIKEGEIIKQHTQKLNMMNKRFTSSEEIEEMSLLLLDSILNEFIEKYVAQKDVILLILYAFKDINSSLKMILMSSIYRETLQCNNSYLQFISDALSTYEKEEGNLNENFKDIEMLLAKDTYGIEILLECLTDTTVSREDNTMEFEHIHLNIEKYVRDIGVLIILRDFSKSNLLSSTTLICTIEGELTIEMNQDDIRLGERMNKLNVEWLEKKEIDKFFIEEKYARRLNFVIKEKLGLNKTELNEFFEIVAKEPATWRLGKKETLENYFLNYIGVDLADIRKFIEVLIRYPESFEIHKFLDNQRNSRISRKCIIPIFDDFYIFSDNVLIEVLGYLKNDVYDRSFYTGDLRKRAEKILNDIDISFEKSILAKLEIFEDTNAKHSLHKITNTEICSPNEIDIIMLSKNDIYVIECKNFLFKSNLRAIKNEVMKMNKSISKKLEDKVDFVNENLELILKNEFNLHEIEVDKYQVQGVIITNKFSLSAASDIMPFHSINYTQIIDYFSGKLNQ